MSHTVLVSDLHLCTDRPAINRIFFEFAGRTARAVESLYILGDLFEYWVGDDDLDDPFNRSVAEALAGVSASGTAVFIQHGNRDFLLGSRFAQASGARLLPDPFAVDLHGTPTLLMHGDLLCTDDVRYQAFRSQVRDPRWQQAFLQRPLGERHALAGQVSRENEQEKNRKTDQIMDVTPQGVANVLRANAYPRLIHGHTHRPARHVHEVDGHVCERWVLTDWYARGGYLHVDEQGCRPVTLEP